MIAKRIDDETILQVIRKIDRGCPDDNDGELCEKYNNCFECWRCCLQNKLKSKSRDEVEETEIQLPEPLSQ